MEQLGQDYANPIHRIIHVRTYEKPRESCSNIAGNSLFSIPEFKHDIQSIADADGDIAHLPKHVRAF
jgi:hypothetical protein